MQILVRPLYYPPVKQLFLPKTVPGEERRHQNGIKYLYNADPGWRRQYQYELPEWGQVGLWIHGAIGKFSWLAMEFGAVPITLSVFLILGSHPTL